MQRGLKLKADGSGAGQGERGISMQHLNGMNNVQKKHFQREVKMGTFCISGIGPGSLTGY